MDIINNKIIPGLIGAIISGIFLLSASIYSDFLPKIMPSLLSVSVEIYLKIISLLFLLLLLAAAIAIAFYRKTLEFKPLALRGHDFGYDWSAKIAYSGKRDDIEIELQWLCPKHKVFLGAKSAEISETAYYVLWCGKCDQIHSMISGGSPVYLQEAKNIVERKILEKLRVQQKDS